MCRNVHKIPFPVMAAEKENNLIKFYKKTLDGMAFSGVDVFDTFYDLLGNVASQSINDDDLSSLFITEIEMLSTSASHLHEITLRMH
ncbi:hypothetical protein CEXT_225261 [Caerostris extrusa]|uniref:Uncharacterized protein n=1 Tax=Caerostris extrusa TaxID=172846 RepID=A0AAV4NEF4_CAEEX|nr:hypothetical protein CEXT_225261 [Caerostris extrusa]